MTKIKLSMLFSVKNRKTSCCISFLLCTNILQFLFSSRFLCINSFFLLLHFLSSIMSASIDNLPDDILLEFFSRYVSIGDLGRLEQVCRRFHLILRNYSIPWKKALRKLTNVSLSHLKNAAGCPSIQVRSFRKKFSI